MFILILVLLFILTLVFSLCSVEYSRFENLFKVLAVSQVVIFFIVCVVSGHMWCKLAEPMMSHEFNIPAMKDNHELYIVPRAWSCEGDTEVRYYFIRPWNGGLKQGYVPSDNSIIYQTDDITPHIECWWKERIDKEKHPFWAKWFLQYEWENDTDGAKEYRIYIPNGSVIEDYDIDLE